MDGETNGAPDRDAGSSSPGGHVSQPRPGLPDDVADLQARVAKLEWRLAEARRRRRDAEATCNTLTRVLEATSDAFVALDADWRYTYVNERAGRMFGREPASLLGKHIWTEFPEGVGQPFHEAYERAVIEREPQQLEAYYAPYDRWFENRIFPYAGGLAIFFQDVTERRMAELRLRESEERYRGIVEQAVGGVYVIQRGRFSYVSPRFAEMVGYDAAELLALPSSIELVHPDDRPRVADRLRRRLAGESVPPSLFRVVRKDGTFVDVEAHSQPVELSGGTALLGFQIDVTDRVRAEETLRRSEARFRSMIENASDAITILDASGTVLYASPSYERVLGLPAEERLGTGVFERIHPDDLARLRAAFDALVETPGGVQMAEARLREPDGGWRHVMAVGQNRLDDPAVRGVVVNSRDITARVRALEALRASEARFRAVVEQSPEAIVLHAGGRILYVNPAGATLLGVPDSRELVGVSLLELVHEESDAQPPARERLAAVLEPAAQPAGPTTCRLVRRDDGSILDVEITSVRDTHAGRPAVQSHLRDVTARKALEAQLTHQAFHDPLTGLANRLLFRDRVEHCLTRLARGEHMAVVLLDLDDFKTVNDSLGHAAGDDLLVVVAERLSHAARGSDTVARFGGDEFALVLEGLAHDDDVGVVLERVRGALRQPVTVGTREVPVSASLGVALARGGEGAEDLLRNADVALYRAKAEGKGRFAIFAPEMHTAAVERLEIEADLRSGLARGEFRLLFQPLVELATGRILGAEALVRWQHPRRGLVLPAAFIPVAEQTGLIVPLGRWVLAEACRQAHDWSLAAGARRAESLRVTVNISARELQEPELASHVAAALADSALVPHQLVLEITESVMLNDAEAALATLREIKSLGIRLAIDDFGTGYSSLAYLQRFPIDVLKMDKSFTNGVGGDVDGLTLARAIVGLGRSLGMGTVAEGIETESQLRRLRELGCDVGQGYLFAHPLLPSAFMALLAHGEPEAPRG